MSVGPRLFLLGDGEVLDALAELAGRLRYAEVHRSDDPPVATPPLGADDYVVVSSRDGKRARELLAAVLAAGDPAYLGLVASEKEWLVALLKLHADRVGKAKLDRISAPAGSATGAETVDEQAIAVAAELIAARRKQPASKQ